MSRSASGIYEIRNTANGKRYIGQTSNFIKRWSKHRVSLREGISQHTHLQNAWNKYGESAFQFSELGRCAPQHLTYFEQAWMDARKPEYNKAPAAGSRLGCTQSAETRAKISAALTGKKKSPEHIRAACSWVRSPEFCAAISARFTGKKQPASQVAKMIASKRGVPWSAARRAAQARS